MAWHPIASHHRTSPPLVDAGLGGEFQVGVGFLPVLFQLEQQKHGVGSVGSDALESQLVQDVGKLLEGSLLFRFRFGIGSGGGVVVVVVVVAVDIVVVLGIDFASHFESLFEAVTVFDPGSDLGDLDAAVFPQNPVGLSDEIGKVGPHERQTKDTDVNGLDGKGNIRHVAGGHQLVRGDQIERVHGKDVVTAIVVVAFAIVLLVLFLVRTLHGQEIPGELGISAAEIGHDDYAGLVAFRVVFWIVLINLAVRLGQGSDNNVDGVFGPGFDLVTESFVVLLEEFRAFLEVFVGFLRRRGVEFLV